MLANTPIKRPDLFLLPLRFDPGNVVEILCVWKTGVEQASEGAGHSCSRMAANHRWWWKGRFARSLRQIWHLYDARRGCQQGSLCRKCPSLYRKSICAPVSTMFKVHNAKVALKPMYLCETNSIGFCLKTCHPIKVMCYNMARWHHMYILIQNSNPNGNQHIIRINKHRPPPTLFTERYRPVVSQSDSSQGRPADPSKILHCCCFV